MELNLKHFQKKAEESAPRIEDVTEEVRLRNISATVQSLVPLEPSEVIPPNEQTPQRPIPLRGVDLEAVHSLPELMCVLTHNLPRNEYNMPKIIYRPDVLDVNAFHLSGEDSPATATTVFSLPIGGELTRKFRMMQDLLDASTIILDYHEGYPAIKGNALWQKFEWEDDTNMQMGISVGLVPITADCGGITDRTSKTAS